jgi:hypothetical protein
MLFEVDAGLKTIVSIEGLGRLFILVTTIPKHSAPSETLYGRVELVYCRSSEVPDTVTSPACVYPLTEDGPLNALSRA